jgi:ABC-type multidrug transport system fused ATPase/permease subunit
MLFFKNFVENFALENKWTIFVYILIIVLFFPFESVVLPKIYGSLFDQLKDGVKGDFFDVVKNLKQMNLQGSIFAVLVAWLVIVLSYGAKHHLEAILVPDFFAHIRKVLYDKTINAFKENYSDVRAGEYLSRMLELMRNAKDLFQYIINGLFPYFIATIFTIGYLIVNTNDIGYVLLISFVLTAILLYFMGNYVMELVEERENYMNEQVNQGQIQNSIDNLMNIYVNNESNNEIKKNNALEKLASEKMNKIMFYQNLTITTGDTIILTGYGISVYIIYKLLRNKKINSSIAIVYILILGQFLSYGMDLIGGYMHNIIYKMGIIRAAEPFLQEIIKDNTERVKDTGIENGNIEFKDIFFRYKKDSDELLFDGLNLKIKGGTSIGVMGRSGSGKTTLMKMLVGLYKPEDGVITIDGNDINTLNVDYLRENVNYVNQNTKLFEETVLYNMKYGNDITEDKIIEKLKKYKLDSVFDDLPDGVNANAGLNGGNLSGGMQKITILMRGILKKGNIIVLDEPLAGLDKNTTSRVIEMILQETVDKTLIVITHDQSILPHLDRVVDINSL